jgi:hypothetical protein
VTLQRRDPVTATSSQPTTATRPAGALLLALKVLAGLAVATVLSQFVTAGQLFPSGGPLLAHQAGAIVLHVVSGLAAVCAVLLWRRGVVDVRLAALAAVVFALGLVQAAMGGYDTLYVHIPGAMLLTTGVVWFLVVTLRVRSA